MPDRLGTRMLEAVERPVDVEVALERVVTRHRRRRLVVRVASVVAVLVGGAALGLALASDDDARLDTVDHPTPTTSEAPPEDCSAFSEIPLNAGWYSLLLPGGYFADSPPFAGSTSPADVGGVSRTELHLRTGGDKQIDLTTISVQNPWEVVTSAEANAVHGTTTVSPCVRGTNGPERRPIEATVFQAADHITLAWQVGKQRAFILIGRGGVFPAELIAIADTLVESAPGPAGGVRHEVPTHCGVISTTIHGQLWIAEPVRPGGFGDALEGWDENTTPGWIIVSDAGADFIADTGVTAHFRPARPGEADPSAGCE